MDVVTGRDSAAMNVNILRVGDVTAITETFELGIEKLARAPGLERFCQASQPVRAVIPAHSVSPMIYFNFSLLHLVKRAFLASQVWSEPTLPGGAASAMAHPRKGKPSGRMGRKTTGPHLGSETGSGVAEGKGSLSQPSGYPYADGPHR